MTHSNPRTSILLVLLVLAVMACAKPLVNPPAMAAAEDPAQTRAAILRALIESNYTVESERPGEIVARYGRSDWNMVVAIDYASEVSVRYLSSENLQYGTKDGTPVIHRGYNKRVDRLARAIGKEIALARIGDGLPAVAAPPPGNAGAQ